MRTTRWRVAAAAAVAVLSLVACAPDGEEPAPTSSTETVEPSYSDEELLEQARETYEGYLAAFEQMVAADEIDYTVLTPYATDEVATNDAAQETELRADGVLSSGSMSLVEILLDATSSQTTVVAHVCNDATTYVFLDESGEDITPADAPETVALTVEFERTDDGQLLVSEQLPINDESSDPCNS